jgi:hypothetical protein
MDPIAPVEVGPCCERLPAGSAYSTTTGSARRSRLRPRLMRGTRLHVMPFVFGSSDAEDGAEGEGTVSARRPGRCGVAPTTVEPTQGGRAGRSSLPFVRSCCVVVTRRPREGMARRSDATVPSSPQPEGAHPLPTHHFTPAPGGGLSDQRCKCCWIVCSSLILVRPSKVTANAFRADFQRLLQRCRPRPVGRGCGRSGTSISERPARSGSGRGL